MTDTTTIPDEVPLIIVAGPAGFEIARAIDEVSAHLERTQPAAKDMRDRVFTISFGEAASKIHFQDLIPAQVTSPQGPACLLVLKDLHTLRPETLPFFESLIQRLAGTKTVCVAAVALPLPPQSRHAFAAVFERLRRDNLARHVTVRPVRRSELEAELAILLDGSPEPALVERTWLLTRGWPSAMRESMRVSRDHDMVRVVDGHAFLTPWHGYPRLTETDELVRWLRPMGTLMWNAVKAIAVLSPLNEALPSLLAEAVDVSEPEAAALLTGLQHLGVLRFCHTEPAWRFRIPLVGAALRAVLGPYEQRRLARIAVEALWAGTAYSSDPGYLPDQLAFAGRQVDPGRARRELLANADRVASTGRDQSVAWLRAAAELTVDRVERVRILIAHAGTSLVSGRPDLAKESATALLTCYADEIPAADLIRVLFLHVMALYEAKDLGALEEIVNGESGLWQGTELERGLCRAFALSLLGRWRETHDLLHLIRQEPGAESVARHIESISPSTDLWLGLTDEFDAGVATLPIRVGLGRRTVWDLQHHIETLLALGEPARADDLLTRSRKFPVRFTVPACMIAAFHRGEFDESLALTRKSITISSAHGCDANQSIMFQLAALLQLSRGKLNRGRELVAMARSRHPALPHVLALPEAIMESMFLELGRARSVLLAAVDQAEEAGVVAHTDGLWISIAGIAIATGVGKEQIPECLQRLDKIADQMGTEPAEIHRLSLRAFADSDHRAAQAALDLLKRRGQPYELAVGIERLVRFGVADPTLLGEAYERFGEMKALMRRAWLRKLMRRKGVAIPGRQTTVDEDERLLTVLVADGLSNKNIATTLNTSVKSVEGKMARLFARTGYHSRVELATATLAGRLDGITAV